MEFTLAAYKLSADELGISEDELREYRTMMIMFDRDGTGTMDCNELVKVMRGLGCNPTDAEVKQIIEDVDTNKTGTVEFKELVEIMKKMSRNEKAEEELSDAFKVFDRDGSGKVSAKEIKEVMTHIGERLTEDEAEEMLMAFANYDANGDGELDYQEFSKMIMENDIPK